MTFGLSAGAIGLIGAGAAVAGGAIAASGAKGAAKTQAASADRANDTNKQIFDQQVALNEPFRQTGVAANNQLAFLLGLTPQQGAAPAAGSPTQLAQGPDGVFAPRAELPSGGAVDPVTQMFRQYLGRDPEPAALDYYQGMLNSVGPDRVRNDISGSQEARTPHAEYQAPQQAQAVQRTPMAQLAAPQDQPPGTFGTAGSLMHNFGAADFAADAGPKSQTLQNFQDFPKFSLADMDADPGRQFRFDEGQKTLERSAAAHGGLFSGRAMKDTLRFAQGLASQEYGNAFSRYQINRGNSLQTYLTNQNTSNLNRSNAVGDYGDAYNRYQTNRANTINPLLSLSGAGQVATGQVNNAAQNFGNNSANLITGAGNAMAAGQIGSANAFNGAIGQGIGMYQQTQLMNRLFPQPGYPAGMTRYDE